AFPGEGDGIVGCRRSHDAEEQLAQCPGRASSPWYCVATQFDLSSLLACVCGAAQCARARIRQLHAVLASLNRCLSHAGSHLTRVPRKASSSSQTVYPWPPRRDPDRPRQVRLRFRRGRVRRHCPLGEHLALELLAAASKQERLLPCLHSYRSVISVG